MSSSKNPKLRFPNFQDEWQVRRLGNLSTLVTSGSRGWAQFYSANGAKFIRMTNLSRDNIYLRLHDLKFVKLPSNLSEGSRTALQPDDILVSITAELGKIGFVPNDLGEAYINQHTALVRIDGSSAIPKWVAYNLATRRSNIKLNRLNDSGAKAGLNLNTIGSFKITLPNLVEQEKIANFLTVVDEKIAAIDKKIALLKRYRKGVTQKIFTQQIRFKDDNDNLYPDWQEKKLGDFFDRLTQKNIENNQNILTISAQQGLVSQTSFFSKQVAAKDLTSYYLLHRNDFAYNKSYSAGYPMGAIKRLTSYDKGVVSTLYICFRAKDTSALDFFENVFNSGLQNSEIEKIAQEGARNHGLLNIAVGDFFDVRLKVPTSKQEMRTIANFLTAIEDRIRLSELQLKKARRFKKGLLQKLFV